MAACRPECITTINPIQHWATMNIFSRPHPFKLTGIVCSIGRCTSEPEMIKNMMGAGMDIARVSSWQDSEESFVKILTILKETCDIMSDETGIAQTLGIAIDTQGPEIRCSSFGTDVNSVDFELDHSVTIVGGKEEELKESSAAKLFVNVPEFAKDIKEGTKVFLDYGAVRLKASKASGDGKSATFVVDRAGTVRNCATINVPGIKFDLPVLSERDIANIQYGIDYNNADIIFASMVHSADDIKEIRKVTDSTSKEVLIVAKIETPEAIENLEQIIREADGIMIARGDLGVEAPPQKLITLQKNIIARCNKAGKPSIVASQLLESMITKPRPTRAELADVTNIVLDGATAILLNFETSIGKYPLQAIEVASNLCKEAECATWYKQVHNDLLLKSETPMDVSAADAAATVFTATMICAAAIIVLTTSGNSAYQLSKFKPCCPIIAVTRNIRVARHSSLYRAVVPVWYTEELSDDWKQDVKNRIVYGIDFGRCEGFIREGDHVIVVYGWRPGPGHTNTMRLLLIGADDNDTIGFDDDVL